MKPSKIGIIAKFLTMIPDQNAELLYIALEIIQDDKRAWADIKALNKGLSFSPINTVKLDELEFVEVDTADLVGLNVIINKTDYSQTTTKVVKVREQKILLSLTTGVKEIDKDAWLPIEGKTEKNEQELFL